MNSRQKGKVGEREFASLLREHGFDARRGQQFSGSPDSPDVVSDALAWLHVEVKRVQNLNLADACAQAEGDQTKSGRTKKLAWVVAHRRNHAPWLITMRAEFFFDLLREFDPAVLTPRREDAESLITRLHRIMADSRMDTERPGLYLPRSASRTSIHAEGAGISTPHPMPSPPAPLPSDGRGWRRALPSRGGEGDGAHGSEPDGPLTRPTETISDADDARTAHRPGGSATGNSTTTISGLHNAGSEQQTQT